MIKNCINCGAPVVNRKCEYCGTEYNEKFSADLSDDFVGTLTYKGNTFKVYMDAVDIYNIDFSVERDWNGNLHRYYGAKKRKFTLFEY